jgi:hypothetical protein
MEIRPTLRIPIFVAEKSQYRNCQQQERVPLVADAPAAAKPEFRNCDHGRPNWPTPLPAFSSKRIDLR